MKKNKVTKSLILIVVVTTVIVSGFSFAKLYHNDNENRISYTLSGTTGKKVTQQDFDGKWSLVTFGFTSCPDVCPLQALTMANTLKYLDKKGLGDRLVLVFISVDYLRDTPDKVQAYVSHFDDRFIGLTGTKAQLDLTTDAFQTRYEVMMDTDTDQASVNVIHSSMLYLVDPSASIIKQFAHGIDASELAKNIETLL